MRSDGNARFSAVPARCPMNAARDNRTWEMKPRCTALRCRVRGHSVTRGIRSCRPNEKVRVAAFPSRTRSLGRFTTEAPSRALGDLTSDRLGPYVFAVGNLAGTLARRTLYLTTTEPSVTTPLRALCTLRPGMVVQPVRCHQSRKVVVARFADSDEVCFPLRALVDVSRSAPAFIVRR